MSTLRSLRSTSAHKKTPNMCYKKRGGGGLQSPIDKKRFLQEARAPSGPNFIPQTPTIAAAPSSPPQHNPATDSGSSSQYWMRRVKWLKCIHQCPPPSSSQPITSWDQWVIVREEGEMLEVTRDREKNNKPLSWLGYDGSYNLRRGFKKKKKPLLCHSLIWDFYMLQVPLWKHLS